MFSKKCSYGIRAVIYLATLKRKNEFISILQISENLGISFYFLTKILQTLTRENILTSYRGPNGGVTFARPSSSITLLEIVEAIDGLKFFTECTLGLKECSNEKPCPLHEQSYLAKDQLRSILESTTVDHLAHQAKNLNLKLLD
ncbi:MAG: Rrf2 family transcriptional regulator [SAR324 cluster bacterium]|nr:Rrf2 family transcriptional regulator [SAR324 cluster bacterium]